MRKKESFEPAKSQRNSNTSQQPEQIRLMMNIPHHILNIFMYEAFRKMASKLYLVELRSAPKNLRLFADQHASCHYQLKG